MNTLIFNTTEKRVLFYTNTDILYRNENLEYFIKEFFDHGKDYILLDRIPTINCKDHYYEIVQIDVNDKYQTSMIRTPILRVPVNNTLMYIVK